MRRNTRYIINSIVAALLLLFVMVSPAQAAFPYPINQPDAFTDDPPPLTPDTNPTITIEDVEVLPQLNLAPTFNFWYGPNQSFGQRGNPQSQINILGNITGETVTSLKYRLNGGSEITVPVGQDTPRLVRTGDFNIALNITDLNNGTNTLTITAGTGGTTFQFNYVPNQVPSLPYTLNWTTASPLNSQAQVVDGLWTMTSAGPRVQQTGYDRLIGLGDMSWQNYEVLVPITVHSWPVGGEGGVGIIANWVGHGGPESLPDDWWLMGAYGYYSNKSGSEGGLAMYINQNIRYKTTRSVFSMPTGVTYLFKLRAERLSSTSTRYSLKAWQQGTAEPAWTSSTFSEVYNRTDSPDVQTNGGILLVAHHADATFGDVNVCPLIGANYTLTTNTSGSGSVSRSPNKSQYACGEGVSLTANPAPGWEFVRWQGDSNSTSATIHTNIVKATSLTAVFQFTASMNEKVFIPQALK